MLTTLETEYYLFLAILGIGLFYIYKAINQISKKDFDFFKKEIYTKESAEKWAIRDGILKIAASLILCAYAGFGLAGYKLVLPVVIGLAIVLGLYFYLYSKTLVKKEIE